MAVMQCCPAAFLHGSNQILIKYHSICSGAKMQMEERIDQPYNHYQTYKSIKLKDYQGKQICTKNILIFFYKCLLKPLIQKQYINNFYKKSIDLPMSEQRRQQVRITVETYFPCHLGFDDEEYFNLNESSSFFYLREPSMKAQQELSIIQSHQACQTVGQQYLQNHGYQQDNNFSPEDSQAGYDKPQIQNEQSEASKMIGQNKDAEKQKTDGDLPFENPSPETLPRKDGHNLSQNLSSKLITLVAKLLSTNKPQKQQIIAKAKEFLKECNGKKEQNGKVGNGLNGQLIVLFIYLFLLKEKAQEQVYKTIYDQIQKYLMKRAKQAQQKPYQQRQPLQLKIRANYKLAQILFKDKYDSQLDFDEIQKVGSDLFSGRQKIGLEKALSKAQKTYRKLREAVSLDHSQTNPLQIHTQFRQQ